MIHFYAKNGVRYAVRYAFRCAKGDLQKRNVLIRYAFRYALLTLLQVLLGGTLPKMSEKNGIFLVFEGRNSRNRPFLRGEIHMKVHIFKGLREKT